jgi:hypothetical protein
MVSVSRLRARIAYFEKLLALLRCPEHPAGEGRSARGRRNMHTIRVLTTVDRAAIAALPVNAITSGAKDRAAAGGDRRRKRPSWATSYVQQFPVARLQAA